VLSIGALLLADAGLNVLRDIGISGSTTWNGALGKHQPDPQSVSQSRSSIRRLS
jgi:hypothetical protein